MPTAIHDLFITRVEDAILSQLISIRGGSDDSSACTERIYPACSVEIHLPVDISSSRNSKHEPDASFWHTCAQHAGAVVEVAYLHKGKRLDRSAGDHLLDANTGIRSVVGLDTEYGKEEPRKATLSVW